MNLYEDNGHNREKLKKIADTYKPPPQKPPPPKDKPRTYTEKCIQAANDAHTLLPYVKYLADYLEFIDKLKSGIFIQYTTDSVLQDVDGRQLMVGHS